MKREFARQVGIAKLSREGMRNALSYLLPRLRFYSTENVQQPTAQCIADLLGKINRRVSIADLRQTQETLTKRLSSQTEWDSEASVYHQTQLAHVQQRIGELARFQDRWAEFEPMLQLAVEEQDSELLEDLNKDITVLHSDLQDYLMRLLMVDEEDQHGCYIEVRSGAGGIEACDFVSILTRMYQRWAESKGFQAKLVEEVRGDVAGLKASVLQVTGDYAYGWGKHESGVHRFCRVSPFDANGKRHTSFASVQVFPFASTTTDKPLTDIPSSDLKIEAMRAQGAGGQHVNKTESAIRIVHIPTGITVFCQNERSQIQNKNTALQMLKAKLYQRELALKAKSKQQHHESLCDNAWGNHIRTYTLQPYRLVKDSRTGHQRTDIQAVLDGDLNSFLESSLLHFNN